MDPFAERRCSYTIPKKNRLCRMLTKPNCQYCGEHGNLEPGHRKRVPCPLDPKHTVKEWDLQEHLQRCNGRLSTERWITENVNVIEFGPDLAADQDSVQSDRCVDLKHQVVKETEQTPSDRELTPANGHTVPNPTALSAISPDSSLITPRSRVSEADIMRIAELIKSWHSSISSKNIPELQLTNSEVEAYKEKMATDSFQLSDEKLRHLTQIGSIIEHLRKSDLLDSGDAIEGGNRHCMVEMGCGKAQLSYWASKVAPAVKFILIDRSGTRYKFENRAKSENDGDGDESADFIRIRAPIEHVCLSDIDSIDQSDSAVAVCKHFCGAATDFGINCLLNFARNSPGKLKGFALVPCCHHRTDARHYVGWQYLRDTVGIRSGRDFALLRHVTNWGVCGIVAQAERTGPIVDRDDDDDVMSPSAKEALGRQAKLLLEYGRMDYLRKSGYSVKAVRYVSGAVSPENLMLMAVKE